ncbi:MAG TPA: LysR family transcriptional regulator [Dongiaceae bacterium]|nr:LysR family transcriptional regulator [Dongiaceae bacterium]
MDWDDLRFVLEVCRSGSALAAAGKLGVNQSTVMRRIAQAEEALGVELFERKQSGYVPTPNGLCVADASGRIEREVHEIQSAMASVQRVLAGTVRFTSSDLLANTILASCLGPFQKLNQGIRVELITDDRRLDIARGEADVALRAGSRPNGAGIVMRRMPDAAWAVYCSRAYADEHGIPKSREEIRGHQIVGMEGPMAQLPSSHWLEDAAPGVQTRFRSNSLVNLVSNLRAGLGVAAVPCIAGDREPELVRCFPPPRELDSEMWLIVREDVKSAPHIRAFADYLAAYLHSIRAQLAGAS